MKLIHNTSTGPIIVCEACFDSSLQTAIDNGLPMAFEDVTHKVPRGQPCDLCGEINEPTSMFDISYGGNGIMFVDGKPFAEVIGFKIKWDVNETGLF